MKIILKLKIELKRNLDLSELSKLNNCNITIKKIRSIKFLYGTNLINIEKVFSIRLIKNKLGFNDFVIQGSSPYLNYLGFNWMVDSLVVHGDVGSYLGQRMKSGKIFVNGNCRDFLGSEMTGGLIKIKKNVGNYVGAPGIGSRTGMNGGEIFIAGNAGKYLANFMRRGLILVLGDVDDYCCFHMIAGSVVIKKRVGKNFAKMMKRGTLILFDSSNKLKCKLKFSNLENLVFLKLFAKYLKQQFDINLPLKREVKRYIFQGYNDNFGEVLIL